MTASETWTVQRSKGGRQTDNHQVFHLHEALFLTIAAATRKQLFAFYYILLAKEGVALITPERMGTKTTAFP